MLQIIRERATGWIAGIIFAVIILSLGLLGVHSYVDVSSRNKVAAVVNDVPISISTFNNQYHGLINYLNKEDVTYEASRLKQIILSSLISKEILRQSVFNQGYRVSVAEAISNLQRLPVFQSNGVFSQEKFSQILAANNINPKLFIQNVADSLAVDQFSNGILFSTFAQPEDIHLAASLFNQQRKFSWFNLTDDYLKSINWQPIISEQQIKDYYVNHMDEFKIPEQVSLEYIKLEKKNNTKASAQIDFDRRCEKLANVSYEKSDNLIASAKLLGTNIYSTKLFSRNNFDKSDPVISAKEVRDAAFSADVLQAGNNSPIIQLNSSTCLVVRLKKHLLASHRSFAEVKNSISEKLKLYSVGQELGRFAKQMSNDLNSKKLTFEKFKSKYPNLVWKQSSGFVTKDTKNLSPDLLRIVFSLPMNSKHNFSYGSGKVDNSFAVVKLEQVKNISLKPNSAKYKKVDYEYNSALSELEFISVKRELEKGAKIKIKMNLK